MSLSYLKLRIAVGLVESVMNDHRDEPEVSDCLVELSSVGNELHSTLDHFETEDISLDVNKAYADAAAFLDLVMEQANDRT